MGVKASRPPDQCSSSNDEMDAYIEAVDDMAISKVKRELKRAGVDPDACVRERLKEERRKTYNGESAPEPDVDSPGKNTRSRKRLIPERPVSSKRKKVDAGEKVYEVEKLMDVRAVADGKTTLRKREFLIRWKGYTETDDTWTAEEDLTSPPETYNRDPVCTEKLDSYILNL